MLSADLALVQTVDFFAPIVDDPYLFGQIAAANALSDVYAMGGEPITALNIVGFPEGKLPLDVLGAILRGGQDKVHEAGALVVGGHTVIDDELKFGLAVTGRAHPDHLLTNAAARPGDRLVLTKPIGTGLLATLEKAGTLDGVHAVPFHASMRALNAAASRAAVALGVRCATDVTGFGLLGHASHIARASGVTLVIHAGRVPLLAGAAAAAAAGVSMGGAQRNRDFVADITDWGAATDVQRTLLVDPQTSGGLLLAVPPAALAEYLSRVPDAVEIGDVRPAAAQALVLA